MLLINGFKQWKTHEPTGTRYELNPIGAAEHQAMRDKATKSGKFDYVLFSALFAAAAIADWDGVGASDTEPTPVSEEAKTAFGRKHALTVMPWVIDEATKVEAFMTGAKEEAKNE